MQVAAETPAIPERPARSFITPRLKIRRPLASDADALFDINSNENVTRYLHWKHCPSRTRFYRNFSLYRKKWVLGNEYFWVIENRANGQLIGYLSSRRTIDTADLGFVIDPQQWGHGYATEASGELVAQLGRLAGIERIVAYCETRNIASAAVLKKVGLSYRGEAREFMQCAVDPNQRYDASLFCLEIDDLRVQT